MKVKELIEELQTVDPELDVILSADSEGNYFNDLEYGCLCLGAFIKDDGNFIGADDPEAMEEYELTVNAVAIFP